MNKHYRLIALIPFLWLGGCTSDEASTTSERSLTEQSSDNHLLKDQAEMLEKAEEVEEKLLDEMAEEREAIEQQAQ